MNTAACNTESIREALKQVIDPELGVNVVDLGLVYGLEIVADRVHVRMTLTTPGCPLHASISAAVEWAVRGALPAVGDVDVELVWEPPWSPARISEAGLRILRGEEEPS